MLPKGWHTKLSKTGKPYYWKDGCAPIWESPTTPPLILYHTTDLGNFIEPHAYTTEPSGIDVLKPPQSSPFTSISKKPIDFPGWKRHTVPFLTIVKRDEWGNALPHGVDVREWSSIKEWFVSTYTLE